MYGNSASNFLGIISTQKRLGNSCGTSFARLHEQLFRTGKARRNRRNYQQNERVTIMAHHHEIDIQNNAKKTLIVIIVTLITMTAEISFGYFTNSMALLSDGWHMGTHVFALTITFSAYILINALQDSELFPNGTGKISPLAGYTSSLFLGVTGLWIIGESLVRFFNPLLIEFDTAALVAVIGLVVNGICLLIMEEKDKNHDKEEDYNYKAAYLHILTDALTSVLAIIALLAGKFLGWFFLDPIMGIVGGVLILRWSIGLIKDTSAILLDMKQKHNHSNGEEHDHCYTH